MHMHAHTMTMDYAGRHYMFKAPPTSWGVLDGQGRRKPFRPSLRNPHGGLPKIGGPPKNTRILIEDEDFQKRKPDFFRNPNMSKSQSLPSG